MHGDLHSGNIAPYGETIIFFDWSDACLAHPFFDLVTFLNDARYSFDQPVLDRLRDAYLTLWTPFEPMNRLREAWAIARKLGALHQVISYQSIFGVIGNESKQEMDGAIAHWLLQALGDE